MREVKLSATREEVARLRELFGEYYNEESKVKRVHKAPDKDYPTVEKYVDHLYEIGMPRGTSVKNMGIILENNYETLSKAPESSEGTTTMTGAPDYGAPSNTLTPDQLKQFQEDLEAKEAKRKAATQHAETIVDAGIKKQQEIYAKQLEQIKAKAKEFEEQTKFAKIKEAKLAKDQQKEIDDLTQNAKADPIKTVEKLSEEIEKRAGGSVPKEAADVAAFEVVSSLSLNYVPVIQTRVADAVSKEAASKGEREVAEWISYLSGENQGIDLSKEIITKTFGQEFTNATLPEVEVSNNPGVGLGPVSLAFIPKEAEEAINERSKVLDEPFLHEADYANKWFGSQLALMQGDRSITQRDLYFSAFKPQGKVDWQGINGQSRLNIVSGASEPLKLVGGAVGSVAKQAASKVATKAVVGFLAKLGAPETGGLTLAAQAVANWVIDHINAKTVRKWSLVVLAAPIAIFGALFGVPILTALGLLGTGVGTARAMGITAAQVGSGTVRVLGALAGATLGAIGLPVLITLLAFPVAVALILFIINSGAYVVPPGGFGLSGALSVSGTPIDLDCNNINESSGSMVNSAELIYCALTKSGMNPLLASMVSRLQKLSSVLNGEAIDALAASAPVDGHLQCIGYVSATAGQAYGQNWGSVSNACSYVNHAPSGYTYRTGTQGMKPGDIFVIGSKTCGLCGSKNAPVGSCGHIGVVISIDGVGVSCADANVDGKGSVRVNKGCFALDEITGYISKR